MKGEERERKGGEERTELERHEQGSKGERGGEERMVNTREPREMGDEHDKSSQPESSRIKKLKKDPLFFFFFSLRFFFFPRKEHWAQRTPQSPLEAAPGVGRTPQRAPQDSHSVLFR